MLAAGIGAVSVIGLGIAGTLYRLGNAVSGIRADVLNLRDDIHDQGDKLETTDANFLRHIMDHHTTRIVRTGQRGDIP